MSLKAIIVDDEKHSREFLKELLEEFCKDVTIVAMASSVKEALAVISSFKPDLVFLDIELQPGTGFDILAQVEVFDFDVIFTSAYEQYAIKAVKFSSLDYLLKPIDVEELQQSVVKAKASKNQDTYKKQLETLLANLQQPKLNKICLTTLDGVEFVDIENIIYCKANGSYTSFAIKNNPAILVSKHLKEYETLLTKQNFMRVHNSFLINLKEVKKYVKSDGGYIIMRNDDIVSISRGKKEDFLNAMSLIHK